MNYDDFLQDRQVYYPPVKKTSKEKKPEGRTRKRGQSLKADSRMPQVDH